ncbi:hypothetical protein EZ456_11720 [Pedobacter psychrodurus]|uniref:Uncharacterized protein n=1 Tax=Pedobacter psychrodurus TaxID=2530456 RepID=A0A4R0PVL0_9SPHI|nr:hypothetical protein [Pedobacter psychrodurus]TCD26624.1 hypothetical protein EZ456_11720 [Pedobacter psychrodurus]
MASLYQRLLIVLLLLIAFAGRITLYAITVPKSHQEVVKENSNKTDKSSTNENNEQLEEKLKFEDLAINRLVNTTSLNIAKSKAVLFSGDYKLLKCYPQALEYPPK